ncbi:MAG: hypothetical protein HW412_1025 [Bacteroidetes bacterium]|nr:hypothetical protein [Bacteroidota bacterium]
MRSDLVADCDRIINCQEMKTWTSMKLQIIYAGAASLTTTEHRSHVLRFRPTKLLYRVSKGMGEEMGKIKTQVALCAMALSLIHPGCKSDSTTTPPSSGSQPRTYRMGFSGIPPRGDLAIAIASIDMWSRRADAAIISNELPWDSLLAGVSPESVAVRNLVGLANYFRFKGHKLWVYIDPANGLNRAGEAEPLLRLGRSIIEPAIQQLYRRWVVVVDSMLRPEHLGLVLETNLIRGLSPPALYAAIRQVANVAAADVRARDTTVKLSVSVQVDYAWGLFGGAYQGIATDFADFPFVQELGLSSYPYLAGFATPEEIPLNYYSRLIEMHPIPVMVTEGGWTSASLDSIISSQEEQHS